jgi:ABC-2 type transport system ATP-binding protein
VLTRPCREAVRGPRGRNQVWDIVRALAAGGATILLSTQHLDEAGRLADEIAVIDHGRVIAEGTPGRLKASVGSGALHVRLLDADRRADAAGILSRTLTADVHLEPDTAALSAPTADAGKAAEAVGELSRSGIGVATFSLGQPPLEEVFLALTGHAAEQDGTTDEETTQIESRAA